MGMSIWKKGAVVVGRRWNGEKVDGGYDDASGAATFSHKVGLKNTKGGRRVTWLLFKGPRVQNKLPYCNSSGERNSDCCGPSWPSFPVVDILGPRRQ
jgi:hypothetical protein